MRHKNELTWSDRLNDAIGNAQRRVLLKLLLPPITAFTPLQDLIRPSTSGKQPAYMSASPTRSVSETNGIDEPIAYKHNNSEVSIRSEPPQATQSNRHDGDDEVMNSVSRERLEK